MLVNVKSLKEKCNVVANLRSGTGIRFGNRPIEGGL